MKKTPVERNPRLGKVGGQAVMEGVMMRSGDVVATSVRSVDGSIQSKRTNFVSIRKKHKFLDLPMVRGVVAFIESMKMSFGTMNDSVNLLGIEEEETKFEKWLKKKFGKNIMDVLMPITFVIAIALSLGIFFWLPTFLSGLIAKPFGNDIGVWRSVIEGVTKAAILIAYMSLISLMPDIHRTFQYHGAEHKSIFCYENGEELTVENVKKQCRFHPRCGTSFLFVMIIIGILVGMFIPSNLNVWLRTAFKILLLPITVGIGYEFLMYAGKHDNLFVKILSAPGLWMQRITTKEPDPDQIEVGIRSLKLAMPDVFPDESMENVNDFSGIAKKAETSAESDSPVKAEETPVKTAETPVETAETPVETAETPVETAEETPVETEETECDDKKSA